MNEWYVYAFELLPLYFQQSRLSCCHSPLACWKSSSSWALPLNFQWQRLRQFDWWKEWVWMTGKLDGHRHSPVLLGMLFYDLETVGNIDGEQHRAKAGSLWYSSGQLFLFWKISFNLYLLIFWGRYDVNHFKAVPPTPKPKPRVSNMTLRSIVSNAALGSSMTRRVTFWSSMFSKISDCTFRSAVSVLRNGL